ncbi:DNA adenine methylase, partial [Limosilactobacillus fermentum]
RFNSKLKFNTPVGVAGYSDDLKNRQLNFIPKTENIELINGSYANLKISKMNKNTVFYFDPPYNITKASYNDGKRGFGGWSDDDEIKLLNFLDLIDNNGQKFILSNVIKHKDKVNTILNDWLQRRDYKVINAGVTGWRYSKDEVLIKNY